MHTLGKLQKLMKPTGERKAGRPTLHRICKKGEFKVHFDHNAVLKSLHACLLQLAFQAREWSYS